MDSPPKKKESRRRRRRQESSSSSSSSDSSEEEERRRKKRKAKKEKKKAKKEKKKKKKTKTTTDGDHREEEASAPLTVFEEEPLEEADAKEVLEFVTHRKEAESSDDEIGPLPLPSAEALTGQKVDYGGALRPGEGSAIAQFVQKNMRVPRRGEVGWQGEEIEKLENVGYVMSGSRHARMNAVRLRKENQVYSAEEKRALALINYEEKQQKEAKIIADLQDMLHKRLAAQGLGPAGKRKLTDEAQPKE